MTKNWQCSKCKQTRRVKIKDLKSQKEKVKCCDRLMRNLSDDVYKKEKKINESGDRTK